MAVSEQTPVNSSTGNGVTTVFPYTFKILAAADLEVTVDGAVKTLTTHYSVSGVGDDAGGDVTFVTAPANATTVIRRRNMALTRTTDYQDQGELPAAVLNADQDAPVLMAQQLQEQIGRSIKAPLGEAALDPLPAAADRALMSFTFDSTGQPSVAATPASVQQAVDEAEASMDAAAASAALAALWATKLVSTVDGTDFSAKYHALLAAASAAAAGLAESAALAAARIYASSAAGLAAVANGEYYYVVSASASETLELWWDNAGVATDTGKRFPSLTAVQTALNSITQTTAATGALWAAQDRDGNVFAYIDQDGGLMLEGETDPVQLQLLKGRRREFAAMVHGMPLLTAANASHKAAIYANSKHADDNYGEAAEIKFVPVMLRDVIVAQGAYYRVPALARISDNHVLLISHDTNDVITTDVQNSRLVACDLTFDPITRALTASASRVLVTYRSITSGAVPGQTAAAFGHTPLVVRHGTNAGRIYLFFVSSEANPDSQPTPHVAKYIYSDDDGATWSAVAVATVMNAAASGANEYCIFSSGPQGIQLRHGTYAGRLVLPAYIFENGGAYFRFICFYSDDGGATWTAGNRALTGSNETAIAEDLDGTIYATTRPSNASNTRDLLKSVDGGVNWTMVSAGYLDDWDCNGAMIQAASCAETGPKFYTSNAIGPGGRLDLRLRVSYGPPSAFDATYQVTSSWAGYSALEMLNEQDGLLVYETPIESIQSDGTLHNPSSSQYDLMAVVFNSKRVR